MPISTGKEVIKPMTMRTRFTINSPVGVHLSDWYDDDIQSVINRVNEHRKVEKDIYFKTPDNEIVLFPGDLLKDSVFAFAAEEVKRVEPPSREKRTGKVVSLFAKQDEGEAPKPPEAPGVA